jgi:hypothetical protein
MMPGRKKTTLSVARLVLLAFGPPLPTVKNLAPATFRAYHFPDPDPRNNRIENLRWAPANTHNVGDPRMREYALKNRSRERSRILTDAEAVEALRMLSESVTCAEVSEYLGVHRGVIDRLIAGSLPHVPRPGGIKPIGTRRLRGDDHPERRFTDDDD